MATSKIMVRIRIPWWVVTYGRALSLFGYTFGMNPDQDKFAKLVGRFAKMEVIGNKKAP